MRQTKIFITRETDIEKLSWYMEGENHWQNTIVCYKSPLEKKIHVGIVISAKRSRNLNTHTPVPFNYSYIRGGKIAAQLTLIALF